MKLPKTSKTDGGRKRGNRERCVFIVITAAVILFALVEGVNKYGKSSRMYDSAQVSSITAKSQTEARQSDAIMKDLLAPSDNEAELEQYSDAVKMESVITSKVDYKILENSADGMTLEITAPNMRTLFEKELSETSSNSDGAAEARRITSAVTEALYGDNCEKVTKTVKVQIDHSGGEPKIVMTRELADAVYGGMLSMYDELVQKAESK